VVQDLFYIVSPFSSHGCRAKDNRPGVQTPNAEGGCLISILRQYTLLTFFLIILVSGLAGNACAK